MVSDEVPSAADYYSMGNSDLAIESRLTVDRLEPRRRLTKTSTRTVIALVGLPARGKSFVARKLYAYLNWYSSCQCKIFNVGKYRRQAYAAATVASSEPTEREALGSCDAQFFDAGNTEGQALRQQVAEHAMRDMIDWLSGVGEGGDSSDGSSSSGSCEDVLGKMRSTLRGRSSERVAIFDATNSTQARREWISTMCRMESMRNSSLFEKSIDVVFVESICDDHELLDENYRYKVSSSPDFRGIPVAEALADLKNRVAKYEAQYETLADDSMSYIKIFNLSTKLMVNHIYGRMAKDIVPALMAWHIGTRPIYLCRPGQTISGIHTDGEDYVNPQRMIHLPSNGRMGSLRSLRGDTLGPNGQRFKKELWEFLQQDVAAFVKRRASVRDYNDDYDYSESSLRIYTSIMPRAADTVSFPVTDTDYSVEQLSSLNPLDKGDLVGLGMDEIQEMNPNWYQKLEDDPYCTRFPGGESYSDIMSRLHSVIIDVEQEVVPTLVVSHVSILQCLMAYFRCSGVGKCMSIEVPLHTVIKFTPVRGGGWSESHHPFYEIPDEVLANNSSSNNVAPPDLNALNTSSDMDLNLADHNTSLCPSKPPPPIWGDGMPTPQTRLLRKHRSS